MKIAGLCAILCAVSTQSSAQVDSVTYTTSAKAAETLPPDPAFRMKLGIDIPVAAAGTAWTLYGFSKIYGRDDVTVEKINSLDRNSINKIDRGTANNYSPRAKAASDKFFYGSMPLPLFLLIDKRIRNDAARVGLLWLESMATTGTIYTASAMMANRFRPYAYNPEVSIEQRTRGGARNSFFAGHVALVGTSTFFMASVLSQYHPEWSNKWILYTVAGAATLTTGYLRVKAGQHFKTDVAVGVAVGTLVGTLMPYIHKNRKADPKLSFYPVMGQNTGTGFAAIYKLNRK